MIEPGGNILILTGPPGAGKSTTARSLVESFSGPAVHLHTDDFWHYIKKGAIAPYRPEANRQNGVVMEVIARAAEGYANGNYFVVVDGIVGPWFLHPFQRLPHRLHYIVLRPPLAVALERCRARGGNTLSAPEPIRALHQQFLALGALEPHVLDTTGLSQEATLAAVQAALASGRFRLTVAS